MKPPTDSSDRSDLINTSELRIDRSLVESFRGPKQLVSLERPISWWDEWEAVGPQDEMGSVSRQAMRVVLLAGAECPFRCTMCDLWQHTLDGPTPPGALRAQLETCLRESPLAESENQTGIKLYNSSNFFDPRAVPIVDRQWIAQRFGKLGRIVVENHPKFTNESVSEFRRQIQGRLEVAIGLETVHPSALTLLNKSMTLDDFSRAAERLAHWNTDLRCFVLLKPPGLEEQQSIEWACKTIEFAAQHGARHVSLIPTRGGNGIMEHLASRGLFAPPNARSLEVAIAQTIATQAAIVTADLWDWDRLTGTCDSCREPRRIRLQQMNLTQKFLDEFNCPSGCTDTAHRHFP